jgi:2,3,4,5-tetrahydropyridine-2-carboxylate N-succinyltransferase
MTFAGEHGAAPLQFYDKVPTKFAGYSAAQFAAAGIRVVPPATARRGAFIASNVVLMPSYVNIGAYVDEGTMVDTWATVGSCAQIGKRVHLSGGVGIGGVLEPLQANPTIIEDDCFIGAPFGSGRGRDRRAKFGARHGRFPRPEHANPGSRDGRHQLRPDPAGSVVVSGSLPSGGGNAHLYCAVIVKKVRCKDAREDQHQRIAARLRQEPARIGNQCQSISNPTATSRRCGWPAGSPPRCSITSRRM